jgi:hypothetical protein
MPALITFGYTWIIQTSDASLQAVRDGTPGVKLAFGVDDIFAVLGHAEVHAVHACTSVMPSHPPVPALTFSSCVLCSLHGCAVLHIIVW